MNLPAQLRRCLAPAGAGLLLIVTALPATPQQSAEMQRILARLDRLEQENSRLREEVNDLRARMATLDPPVATDSGAQPADGAAQPQRDLEEKVEIQGQRIAEHEQDKVGSSQRFPLRITGMALFNLYANGAHSSGRDYPLTASLEADDRAWGGSLRQSVIGLEYDGPRTVWGGKVRGNLFMDFFDGSSEVGDNLFRIRTGSIQLDWNSRTVMVGLEKPLFAPRDPTSYGQVGVSPLSGAGNLWRWLPQVRLEQRLGLGASSGMRAQVAFVQTSETYAYLGEAEEYRRPGIEGRLELWHRLDDTRRIEFAPGFHFSRTLAGSGGVASNLVSLDWFANPWKYIEFSGAFFRGQNVNHFGAPHAGFTELPDGSVIPVHAQGGWAQLAFPVTNRLSFHIYGGEHENRNRDLLAGDAGLNRAGAANVVYRLAPNVVLSLEANQVRTSYLARGRAVNNHYDLAVAYLF